MNRNKIKISLIFVILYFIVNTAYACPTGPYAIIANDYLQYRAVGTLAYFDGTDSYDPDNGDPPYSPGEGITQYWWEWSSGAGFNQDTGTPTHTYDSPGYYTVSLGVVDDEYQSSTGTDTCKVRVIKADITDSTTIYSAYQSSNTFHYTISPTSGWTPNWIKLTISEGETVIRSTYLYPSAGTSSYSWNGKDNGGNWVYPGVYNVQLEVAKSFTWNGSNVYAVHTDSEHTLYIVGVDLDVDSDRDGYINDNDEPYEENSVSNPKSAYVNLNNDSDNSGEYEDMNVDSPGEDEDDLQNMQLALILENYETGYVTLERSNTNIRVWSNPKKGDSTKRVLYSNSSKTWNLSNSTDLGQLQDLVANGLYVEGCVLGECAISAYYQATSGGAIVYQDDVLITVCPGPPKEYEGWGTMTLNMIGGQLHTQWKHFSETNPSDSYFIYMDENNNTNNPFEGVIPSTIDGYPDGFTYADYDSAYTMGYIYKDSTYIGAYYIQFPSTGLDGQKCWVLVRSYDTTTGLQSQNTDAYPITIDHPDNGLTSATLAEPNFYVPYCDQDYDDVFFIEGDGSCEFCDEPGSAYMWRVARSSSIEPDPGDLPSEGSYYSDSVTALEFLRAAAEGDESGKIFYDVQDTFGDCSDDDNNGRLFCLVTDMMYGPSGLTWCEKDAPEPWSNQNDKYLNKGNFSDLIYLNADYCEDSDFFKGTFAHELQHNVHYNAVDLNASGCVNEQTWINESCSQHAIEITGYATSTIYPTYQFCDSYVPSILSLTRYGDYDVYNRFHVCPWHDSDGEWLWNAHYEKVMLWMHYLVNNVGHQASTSIETFVADEDLGIDGVDDFSDTPILQKSPNGPFINWTIANYANQLISGGASDYNYDSSSIWADYGVTPYTMTLEYEEEGSIRDLAAIYLKFEAGEDSGTFKFDIYDIDYYYDIGDNLVVNAVRLDSSGNFIDVLTLTGSTLPVPENSKRYTIPGTFGSDYESVVIVITNLESYKEDEYQQYFSVYGWIE